MHLGCRCGEEADCAWQRCTAKTERKLNRWEKRKPELLEVIREKMNLLYISDIPRIPERLKLAEVIERESAEDYPSEQWKDLLLYILKTK